MSITPDNIESADTNQVLLGAVDKAEKAMDKPNRIIDRVRQFLRRDGGAPLNDEPTAGPPSQNMNRRGFLKAGATGALAVAFGAQALAACGEDEIDVAFEKSEDLAGKFAIFVGEQVEALTTNLQMFWGGTLNTFDLREDPINLKQLRDAAASLDSRDPDDLDVSDKVLGFLYKEVVQPALYVDEEYTEKVLKLPKGNLQELFTEWYMLMKCSRYLTQERNANKLKAKFAREKADIAYDSPSSDKAEQQLDIAREKLANARESGDKSNLYYFERAVQQAERDLQVANASQRGAVEGASEKADKAEKKVDQLRNIVSGLLAGELHARNDFGDAMRRAN